MTTKGTSHGVGLPAGFPFSLAGEAYGLCFISGMPALDPDGKFVPGTFEEETELAWHNVAAIAEASGCAIDDIVYVQCVLSAIDNYGDLNAWWRRQFPDISTAPARFTFQAGALPFGAKIEFQAIAARGNMSLRTMPGSSPRLRGPGLPGLRTAMDNVLGSIRIAR